MGEGLKRRIKQVRFESDFQEAVLNLLVAADFLRDRTERICLEHGVTAAQYNVLRILRGVYPEGHPRCEIAQRMIERAPDVTRLVDRLEKQGLAQRDRSGMDRRLSLTRITEKGLALLEAMEPQMREMQADFAGRVGEADSRELSRICESIYEGS